jgi:hypothetical protein
MQRQDSWLAPFQQDKMERRVQIYRFGIVDQLPIHRLNQVGTTQVEQILGIRLD